MTDELKAALAMGEAVIESWFLFEAQILTLLEGTAHDEALFHLNKMANDWHDLALCLSEAE